MLCLDARQGKIFGKGSSKSSGRAPSANTSPSVTPFLNQKYRKHLSDDVEESDPYASRSVYWSPLFVLSVDFTLDTRRHISGTPVRMKQKTRDDP